MVFYKGREEKYVIFIIQMTKYGSITFYGLLLVRKLTVDDTEVLEWRLEALYALIQCKANHFSSLGQELLNEIWWISEF